ncbi:Ig-like domain-containing protein, partial [Oceanihabitans sp. 2_MG-2023]|uniref:Ig-like domain-containing protein n=1 Tax=Oceanihabitans sp. 2_MG-2023 TaxID=3062661 RepID=UPI0026E3F96A
MKKVTLFTSKTSKAYILIGAFIYLLSTVNSFAQCDITVISTSMISACSDGGTTPDPSDDTFTADITVTFDAAPATGNLVLSGDSGAQTVDVTTFTPGVMSYTFSGINMAADGTPIDITASFVGDATCTSTFNEPSAGLAPASCSPDCEITNITVSDISACSDGGTQGDPSDDTYTADITVTYSNPPSSGNIILSGDGTRTEAVGSIGATSYTFQDVSMPADGGPIDATVTFSGGVSTCTLSVSTGAAPASCSPDCIINGITASNISICNDGGTQGPGNEGDDTFTADITVTFDFAPATGTLDLTGDGSAAEGVGTLDSATSHTFVGVQFSADGGAVDLTASFSDAFTSCVFNLPNTFTAQSQCSAPVGDGGLVINKTHCDWGYTTDDRYRIRYSGTLTNTGSNPVYNISITDDLGTPFLGDANIVNIVSRSAGPLMPTGVTPNGSFNGTTNEEVIIIDTLSELDPGESIQYAFCIEVDAVPALDGATVINEIFATANDAVTGDPFITSATDVELFEENLSILSAGLEISDATPAVNTDGTSDFFYTITLRNSGSGPASNIQYVDSFDHLFASGIPINTFVVTQLSGVLNANPGFDGGSGLIGTSTDLLIPGQTMAANTSASYRVDLNVGPTGNQTTRNTQGVITGEDSAGTAVSDISRRNLTAEHDDEQCFCEETPVQILFAPIPVVTKTIINNDPAGTLGNRDITFQIEIENDPTSPVDIFNLQVVDDISAMCPGNIVSVGAPQIITSTATVDPVLNAFYTGQGLNNIFENNTGQFAPGERLILTIDVEITLPCTGDNTATFTATDPNGTVVGPVTDSVSINNPPEAEDNTDNTNVDTLITIDPLDNDSDPDSDPIIITEVDNMPITEGGAPVLLSDGTIVQYVAGELEITPPPGSNTPISFPYTVADPLGNEDTANIFITINTCTVAVISLTNIGACDSNGTTGDSSDDTFTADVVVEFTNPPGAGNLDLTGAGINTFVPVSGLFSSTQHTFSGLTFSADGADVILTGTFDNPSGCTDTQNAGTAPDSCSVAEADMGITKTLNESGPFETGDTVSWNIVVSNDGTDTANNVIVTDTPTNVTITNVLGGGCTTFPCNVGTVLANSPASDVTIVVTGTIDGPGAFTNVASVSADEVDVDVTNDTDDGSDGNNDGVATGIADISVTKTLDTPAPYNSGDTISYTIVVSNDGPDPANNVMVTDTPTNLTLTSVSGGGPVCVDFDCNLGTIPSGGNITLLVTGTIDDVGAFTNDISVLADETDPDLTNNMDEDPANGGVASGVADVGITKTLDTVGPYTSGDTVTYTLVVSNAGPDIANNIVVTDAPNNLTISSVFGGGCTSFPCTISSIAPGSPANDVTITVTAVINGSGAFTNNASVSADELDNNPVNDTDDDAANGGTASGIADLITTKVLTSATNTPAEGDTVTYTISVVNNGPDDATNVSLSDVIPVELTATANNGNTGGDQPSTYLSPNWTIPFISSGQFVTLIIEGTVNLGEDGNTITNTTTAATTPDQVDPTTAGDDLIESITVDGCIDTDGDGDCDSTDPDPADPCVFTAGSVADTSNAIWQAADCDGDGDPNGTDPDPTDPCEFTVGTPAPTNPGTPGSSEQAAYDIWALADCDGDGVTNGQEVIDLTNPYNSCEYLPVNQDYTITTTEFQDTDCDGDGVTNANEIDPDGNGIDDGNGTDPDDPCEYEPLLVTETQTGAWILADCDGDGDPNGSDPDPIDPCVFSSGTTSPTDPVAPGTPEQTAYDIWAAADCDGDGDSNGTDPDPQDPCVFTAGSVADTSNAIWQAADCDGDGETNGTEDNNGSDPTDPCSVSGTQTIPSPSDPNYSVWAAADCDGDGETNGEEIMNGTEPFDPCSVTNPTIPTNPGTPGSSEQAAYDIWAAADCDGDGDSNGTDPDPQDPCVFTAGSVADTSNAIWQAADCDGDGDSNGTDPDPQDPCVFTAGSVADTSNAIWQAADCDGDGDSNGTDPDPQDPCVFTAGSVADTSNAIWQAADCDGDGETNAVDPAPYDPCVGGNIANVDFTDNNTDWYTSDCDGDGVINGTEVDPDMDGTAGPDGTDPTDPCDYNVADITVTQTGDWLTADCDGDGDPNGTDPEPLDPCVFTAGSVGDASNPVWADA